ncbi:MAG: hypothetical protein R8P61_22525 [Bacteroidia bacterium]|nr:hypothetical protein [Bacteroidia bacterium]
MDPITQKLIELNPKRRKYAISYLLENYEKGSRGKVVGQLIELCGEGMRLATFHKIRGLKIGEHGSMRGDHILLMMDFFGIEERKYFELYNAQDLSYTLPQT